MKYFKLDEFACPCCGENAISNSLTAKLDKARGIAGVPFIVNSGYRCEKHNRDIGGSPTSSHLLGLAVDIKSVTSRERYKMIRALMAVGFTRLGIGEHFIHADIDTGKSQEVCWTYYNEN